VENSHDEPTMCVLIYPTVEMNAEEDKRGRLMSRHMVAFVVLSLAGCSPVAKEAPKSEATLSKTTEPSLPSDLFGTWKVVKHYEPGISAMDKAQADTWIGKSATYEVNAAKFEMETCADARYTIRTVDDDQFFSEYRIPLKSVDIDVAKVSIIDVTCAGSDWIAPGSLLVVKNRDRVLTLWDGVFFELSKS
jgi:hypothetical protein